MPRYHINDKDEPGVCKAMVQCPFGDLDDAHYDTAQEARTAVERKHKLDALRVHRKKTSLKPHGLLKFDELRYFDYAAFDAETTRLSKEWKAAASKDKQALYEARSNHFTAYAGERDYNAAIEKERLLRVFSHLFGDKSAAELLASQTVTTRSVVTGVTGRSHYRALASVVPGLTADYKEKFYNLPSSYYNVFISKEKKKQYSAGNIRDLIMLSSEMQLLDPAWRPSPRPVRARSGGSGNFGSAPTRTGEALDIYNVSDQTNSLLEDLVKQRFGLNKADKFWTTVASPLGRQPKLSDFLKAYRSFKG